MFLALVLITLAYLSGSFCSAIIVCRVFNLPDPREEGSKNPGATNVLRIAGKQYAALVFLVDMLKGTLPVLLAKFLGLGPVVVAFIVLAAVIGHIYPIFFRFKGGKGVATAIGALLGYHFILGVMVIATWLIIANFFRYSSLASLIAITLSPIYSLAMVPNLDTFPLLFMAMLIIFQHKENITRLLDGTEPKIKFKLKSNVISEIFPPQRPETAKEEPVKHETAEKPKARKKEKPE